MLIWIFGDVKSSEVHVHTHDRAAGYLELERARVKWFLSINYDTIPEHIRATGARTHRSLTIENEEFEFSGGFHDLHTRSYEQILLGGGFKISESKKAIQTVYDIRKAEVEGVKDHAHPLARLSLVDHPFIAG